MEMRDTGLFYWRESAECQAGGAHKKAGKAETFQQVFDNLDLQADGAAFLAAIVVKLAGNENPRKNSKKNNAYQKTNKNPFGGGPEHGPNIPKQRILYKRRPRAQRPQSQKGYLPLAR
ncbi:MAG: hypothetical protein LBT33_08995, partial [Spirochaetia bacterium]|nr:hypothetical protein [Spirochaetia bacterium]